MAKRTRIVHTIDPTFDERSRVLVLGTMPSPASRELGFNYGHPRNRFWRVMAELAGEPLPATNERKRDFCLRHHIALWDVLAECSIEGASDASIAEAVPNRLTDITCSAPIEAVFCTGSKSFELYRRLCAEEVGIEAVKLPSTSPANAACSFETLIGAYAEIFEHEHPYVPPELDVPEVVALEQAIAAAGTPLRELMERAGAAVAWRVQAILDEVDAASYPAGAPARELRAFSADAARPLVTLLCGNGNNGGDAWVAAALLAQAGVSVCLLCARLPEQLTAQPARDAALEAIEGLMRCGARIVRTSEFDVSEEPDFATAAPLVVLDDACEAESPAVKQLLQRSCLVVDAMLGTGAAKAPRPPFLNWIRAANGCADAHATLAVDVPTGVDASSGKCTDPHLPADETLTMIVRKPGLSAPECGIVRIAPLAYLEPVLAGLPL